MRIRLRNEGTHPSVPSIEYAWDKSVNPYRKAKDYRSPYDDQSAYYNWTPPTSNADFLVSEREEIYDDTGTDGAFRPCLHTFVKNEYILQHVNHSYYGGHSGNGAARSVTALDYAAMDSLQSAPDIDWDEMANEACSFMVPRINEGTSVINSLLELKDVKRMNPIPSLKRLQGRYRTLRQLSNKKERAEFLREVTTRMNNAHLNASFGIVPLLADVVAIHDELTDLVYKLSELKRNAGKRQQRHYKRVLPVSDGVFASRDWVSQMDQRQWFSNLRFDRREPGTQRYGVFVNKRSRWVKRPVYHATMRYSYTLPKADSTHELALARLDALGIRLDPSIVWNAVRYSFIVDWVVDVGGFLRSMARDNYPINTTIHSFCHSYSWHKQMDMTTWHHSDTHPLITGNPAYGPYRWEEMSLVSTHTRKSYDRRLANPDYSAIATRALKYRQAALAGSLFLSRTRWGRNNRYMTDAARPAHMSR